MTANPLIGFRVEDVPVSYVGRDLQRPECILAEPDGTLWSADGRGGVMKISPDGSQRLIAPTADAGAERSRAGAESLLSGTLPNGLAFARNGDILIANFGTDRLEQMTREGAQRVLLDNIDGRPIGKVNFVLRDSRDRLWITVSTELNPWSEAIRKDFADGFIVLLDEAGPRIVADGLHFTNEVRFDADETWLYAAETTANRVSRFRVGADGSLTDREVFGPADLGDGMIDGFAFDAHGNLWVAQIMADRLVAITPEGDLLELFCDGDAAATRAFEAAFAAGGLVPPEMLMACGGKLAPLITSVTFGGPNLTHVYLGSLRGASIPCFRSPVPGLPMIHWR